MASISFVPSDRLVDMCEKFKEHPNQSSLAINIASTLTTELELAHLTPRGQPDTRTFRDLQDQRTLAEDSPQRRWNLNFPKLYSACGSCGDMIDPEAKIKVWLSWGAPAHCQKPECTPKGILRDAR